MKRWGPLLTVRRLEQDFNGKSGEDHGKSLNEMEVIAGKIIHNKWRIFDCHDYWIVILATLLHPASLLCQAKLVVEPMENIASLGSTGNCIFVRFRNLLKGCLRYIWLCPKMGKSAQMVIFMGKLMNHQILGYPR